MRPPPTRLVLTGRGRLLAAVLALACLAGAALAAAGAWPGATDAAAATPPRAAAVTPLWSLRRVPTLVVDQAGRRRLQDRLGDLLAPYDACVAVADGSRSVAAVAPRRSLAPASTEKLLTSAAALRVLGPDHRFTTTLVATAPVRGGVIAGDAVLVGGGDPGLVTPAYARYLAGRPRTRLDPLTPLADLADAVVAAGVRRIDGAVLGDDSRQDTTRFLPDWKPNYRWEGQSGPLGALVVDHGFVAPGAAAAVDDPASAAAADLVDLLAERGVAVGRGAGRGRAPDAAATVAEVHSAPLRDVVAGLLTSSDNFAAEILAREVGVAAGGDGGTAAGTDAVEAGLRHLGLPTDGVDLLDGSGLAPGDRATCDAVLGALRLGSRPRFTALDTGLPVAGETGTLAARFVGDPLAGVLRAKTGQLSGVVGFAGVVDGERPLRFAFLANGAFGTATGHDLQEAVARAVAAFPDVPAPAVLVPAPGGAVAPSE